MILPGSTSAIVKASIARSAMVTVPGPTSPLYLRLWFFFGCLFVAGTIIMAAVHGNLSPLLPASPHAFGEAVGSSLIVMILPALVVVPWRLIEQRWRATGTPLFVGSVLWGIALAFVIAGARMQ